MKLKRRWLLLIVPLALFAWAYRAASWRPKLFASHAVRTNVGRLMGRGEAVSSQLLISPDGRQLAAMTVVQSGDALAMFEIGSKRQLWQERKSGQRIWPLAFSPDNRALAVATQQVTSGKISYSIGKIKLELRDAATGGKRASFAPQLDLETLQSAGFLSDQKLVIATSQGASIVDIQRGATVRQWQFELPVLPTKRDRVPDQTRVSANGKSVLALTNGQGQTVVARYDAATGKARGRWNYPQLFRNPRLSPDGKLWVMQRANPYFSKLQSSETALFDIYDASSGRKIWGPFESGEGTGARMVNGVSANEGYAWDWSADSRRICAVTDDSAHILNARTGAKLSQVPAKTEFGSFAIAPDENYFYTLDSKGEIWRWRLR